MDAGQQRAFEDMLSLVKAEDASAQAQAAVADTLGGLQIKLAESQERVLGARLANVATALNTDWDIQAHTDLQRWVIQMRQAARRATRRGMEARAAYGDLGLLCSGMGAWEGIRDGWRALAYWQRRAGVGAFDPLAGLPEFSKLMLTRPCWRVTGPLPWREPATDIQDLGSMFEWARNRTYQPTLGGAARAALMAYIHPIGVAARDVADKLAAAATDAAAIATAIAQQDWRRLETSRPTYAKMPGG